MAQNIEIAGAVYESVPSVRLKDEQGVYHPFVDSSDATAEAGDIALGKTAYVDGSKVTGTGTQTVVEPLSVTENGTYTASAGHAYSPVMVDVAGGGGGGDIDALVARTITSAAGSALGIGMYAFAECDNLVTASFPAAISIGANAFSGCAMLKTVSFPFAETISVNAFNNCTALLSADFPSVRSIANMAFAGCSSLSTVNFPSATSTGSSVFRSCTALTTASFQRIASFGSNVFIGCVRLTELYLTNITGVPGLGTNTFSSTPIGGYSAIAGQFGSVYVPASLYESFMTTTTKWSSIASRIVSV